MENNLHSDSSSDKSMFNPQARAFNPFATSFKPVTNKTVIAPLSPTNSIVQPIIPAATEDWPSLPPPGQLQKPRGKLRAKHSDTPATLTELIAPANLRIQSKVDLPVASTLEVVSPQFHRTTRIVKGLEAHPMVQDRGPTPTNNNYNGNGIKHRGQFNMPANYAGPTTQANIFGGLVDAHSNALTGTFGVNQASWNMRPPQFNPTAGQFQPGPMSRPPSSIWRGSASGASDRTVTPSYHFHQNQPYHGHHGVMAPHPAALPPHMQRPATMSPFAPNQPVNGRPFQHQPGPHNPQGPSYGGVYPQQDYNHMNMHSGRRSVRPKKIRPVRRYVSRARRTDQGPEPSGADIYPDDSAFMQENQNDNGNFQTDENAFPPLPFPPPKQSDVQPELQSNFNNPFRKPTPGNLGLVPSFNGLPTFLHNSFTTAVSAEDRAPEPVDNIQATPIRIRPRAPSVGSPIVIEDDKSEFTTTPTGKSPTFLPSIKRPPPGLNRPALTPMPSRQALATDQLDGSRYGLRAGGLGLHRLGDVWMPSASIGDAFEQVRHLWDDVKVDA
ncbi:hypothetical protein B0J11DRAFT_503785 [Dendryphion nanum]|uniref:Uncharacterized protein n=1 Tax=Dendryphion nanum TaxID=256645 RepID=A0A9P9IRK9_9PLEO|nr:hypothetical protein B0J11DRAFT_503785 [Dendryphion nanum]